MRLVRKVVLTAFALTAVLYLFAGLRQKLMEDSTVPVIISDREVLQISVKAQDQELLTGLNAFDEKDGDLTDEIMVGKISKFTDKGAAWVSYIVFDQNNNAGQFMRKVEFTDYTSPRFLLTDSLDFRLGETVNILDRLRAEDSIEGDISDKIRVVSGVADSRNSGVYQLKVQVSNQYEDTVEQDLFVNVGNYMNGPEIILSSYLEYIKKGQELIPESYVEKIVDSSGETLSKEQVKISSEVDTKRPGTYQVTFTVTGITGNQSVKHMLVVVEE